MATLLLLLVPSQSARAQAPRTGPSSIHGVTTTQGGATVLPGVVVTLSAEAGGTQIDALASDAQGRFLFRGLDAGVYRIRAALAGFNEVVRTGVTLVRGQDLEVNLDVALALSDRVDAVSQADPAPTTATSRQSIEGKMIDIAPVKGDDFDALLPMMPGVVRGPDGRINMKGGRPTQTGLQLSQAYVSDPATGDTGFNLPVDAVESIDVLPNPYAAEYGRFSAGLTKIETRKGTNRWRATANNFIPAPCLKLCDGKNIGIRSFDPRLVFGGPVIADRLFLSQSFQYHDHKDRVPSLTTGDDTSFRSLDAFTRLDASIGRNQMTGTIALFPRNNQFVNLNTFNPQPVTANFRQRGYNVAVVDSTRVSDTSLFETTVNFKAYRAAIDGQGAGDMVIAPDGNSGNFFNHQIRETRTAQWVESFRTVRRAAGDHLLKIGIDLLHVSLDGSSEGRPVEVRREDGTLAQRVDFGAPSVQRVQATDVGAYLQDGWRWNDRVLMELGLRIDRDGVIEQTNVSPRLGVVVGVLPEGKGIVRGGTGLFYERTPLLVGAFGGMETRTVTRFATDALTPAESAVPFVNRSDTPLGSPSAWVWNLEYDHRIAPGTVIKINHLARSGSGEFLIEPVELNGSGVLALSSRGRSHYQETELTLRYAGPRDRQVTATYVRSRSEGDLNSFDVYFGNVRNPLVRPNQYSLTSVDVPNRLIVLSVLPVGTWRVSPLVEIRDGFPYSIVDGNQDFVGRRNGAGRFPLFYSIDLNVSRTMVIRRRTVRLGVKANHLLNNFAPRDVQANITSPAFGTFYNSIVPRLGLTVEIRP